MFVVAVYHAFFFSGKKIAVKVFLYLSIINFFSIHTVSYLPAINDSPTKMDVILELLEQSKLKAEQMELEDTDVVSDQAVYAKCFEVLMNPKHEHLKKFIVLRMGGFHIITTYLAVIGKRFADGGLRDLIVEAELIGI